MELPFRPSRLKFYAEEALRRNNEQHLLPPDMRKVYEVARDARDSGRIVMVFSNYEAWRLFHWKNFKKCDGNVQEGGFLWNKHEWFHVRPVIYPEYDGDSLFDSRRHHADLIPIIFDNMTKFKAEGNMKMHWEVSNRSLAYVMECLAEDDPDVTIIYHDSYVQAEKAMMCG